jgi:hypothetical protein
VSPAARPGRKLLAAIGVDDVGIAD